MSKVVTVTLNPAFDVTLHLGSLSTERVNRPQRESRRAAGKGVNISQTLTALGCPTVAVAIVGSDSMTEYSAQLSENGIAYRFIPNAGSVRENLTLLADGQTVKINRGGQPVGKEACEQLRTLLAELYENGDIAVFSGSVPPGIEPGELESMVTAAEKAGYRIALDSETFTIEQLQRLRPWLIKPNEFELEMIAGQGFASVLEMLGFCSELIESGVEQILLSLGEYGLYLITEKDTILATPPKTEAVNTVGAGDSALAGYIHAVLHGMDCRQAAAYSAACGCAAVMSELPFVTDPREVTALAKQISIT